MSTLTSQPVLPAPAPYTLDELKQFGLIAERRPRHIAIIMDGNGRWAQAQGLPRIEGHQQGVLVVRKIVEECSRLGIEQLTLYCFSSENWKRPALELRLLMELLERYLVEERPEILRQNLQFCVIGRRDGLSDVVLREMQTTTELSQSNTGMRLCLAINYGSRCELVDAARELARDVEAGRLSVDEITEAALSDRLYTGGMPDPDLVIRTAGEMRISNFLLWQISYAELWVTSRFWPEFDRSALLEALRDYASRNRRFGGLSS